MDDAGTVVSVRRQLVLTGVVQGVGFRPNVVRLAARFPVAGLCGNDDNAVFLEAQGLPEDVAAFLTAVQTELPPLATIVSARESPLPLVPGDTGFHIVTSRRAAGAITLLPADSAVCADCVADMADPANRRYAYPFTTCTNCGPRLTIIVDVPYDRPLTTMAEFPMCPACRAEYEDPSDRRYHAQPIACFDCGPDLWLELVPAAGPPRLDPADRRVRFAEVIRTARQMLRDGRIVAVKGIGGFTLMCDARNEQAVDTLRTRKRRPGKPLAVMAGSVAAAARLATLGPAHRRILSSREAPIVLAPLSPAFDLAPGVAPGLDDVGVMLPYAPLHRLLLDPDDVVVATSANSSSLPLTYRNDDARRDLSHIVDAFLMHNRDIHVPVEDSVVMTEAESVTPIRRSRGYAPLPVWLGSSDHCVLAVGAELKNTFALTRDGMAFLSAHIGDMGSLETQRAFEASVAQMRTAHRRVPELIVVDKHPGYATHAWGEREAERLGVPLLAVQHHHAHALALRAECPDGPPETSVVLDGTGYGDDETIWGGEILMVGEDPLTFERAWHLPGFWLAGGDSAIRHPWKSALGLLAEYGAAVPRKLAAAIGPDEFALVRSQLANHAGVVRTTSAGRVFDAIAALTGVCLTVTYEAQAAMELETVARRCPHDHPATATTVDEVVAAVLAGLADDRPVPCLAHQFHTGLVHVIARAVAGVAAPPAAIGLTGGVFANRLISDGLASELTTAGYTVRRHRVVPSNDGGLSLGQALAGLAALDAGEGRMKPLGHTKEAG